MTISLQRAEGSNPSVLSGSECTADQSAESRASTFCTLATVADTIEEVDRSTGLHDLQVWFEDRLDAERHALHQFMSNRHHALQAEFYSRLNQRFDQSAPMGNGAANVGLGPPLVHLGQADSMRATSTSPQLENGILKSTASVKDFVRRIYDLAVVDSLESKPGISLCNRVEAFVGSGMFELVFGVLIILNAIVLFAQLQYQGVDNGRLLKYYTNVSKSPEESWPGARQAFDYAEWIFGAVFTLEVIVKLLAFRHKFVIQSYWNVFDAAVVVAWITDRIRIVQSVNPMMLRLARLSRLARLLRIVRWISLFDPLQILVKAIRAGMSVLFWSLMLLVVVITVIALAISQLLEPFILDDTIDSELRVKIFENWGTAGRSVVTMFEITLANWGPPCRLLMNGVNEWWGFFIVAYKCSVGFAVVQVITSVFIQQTFKVAARDEEVMIAEKKAAARAYLRNLRALFDHLDRSGDGLLTKDEFLTVVDDKRVKAWFAALEIEITEASSIFDLLDDGDGEISKDEFLQAVKNVKGVAKGMDLLALRQDTRKVRKLCSRMNRKIDSRDALAPLDITFNDGRILV